MMYVRSRQLGALTLGFLCHSLFLAAIMSAFLAMYHGMQSGLVRLSSPMSYVWDAALLMQFPILHSFLLSKPGGRLLTALAPAPVGRDLVTTSFTLVASVQLLLLYLFWAPVGPVWWEAEGATRVAICFLYLNAWLLLGKAMSDAGLAVQTGFLGWSSVFRNQRPNYGGMPSSGLFRLSRQPIYLAFALTVWTVPVWTPDQLVLAIWFTSYCLLGPLFKERRYRARYGEEFAHYRKRVPYFFPRITPVERNLHPQEATLLESR